MPLTRQVERWMRDMNILARVGKALVAQLDVEKVYVRAVEAAIYVTRADYACLYLQAEGNHLRLIDVREPHELEISRLDGATLIPLGQLAGRMSELDSAEDIVLFCKSGTRSARALELLASAGFRKMKNLKGGINAWAREIDSSLPIY